MALSNEAKESILQAMDIIATKASSQINFDSTIKGFIINNDKAEDGEYTIAFENTKFIAYSENTSYNVDDCVRISIPNNDFSEKKYILGKCASDNGSEPITYASVTNTILEITSLVNNSALNVGIEANNESKSKVLIPLRDISQGFEENEAFNVLFLEASFLSNLNDLKMTGGTYGLSLSIFDKSSTLIHSLKLDSSEFFGDPYSFNLPVRQSKKLNISDLSQIGSFVLELYQDNNFFYYQNNELKTLEPIGQDNIFVKSIKIGLGTDLNLVEDDTVKLYCKQGLDYDKSEQSRDKDISLLWYNKTKDNTYVGFSDGIAQTGTGSSAINRSTYDENNFLQLSNNDSRLKGQQIEEVPTDINSLGLRADIFVDGIDAVNNIYTAITKDLISLSGNFETRMKECADIKKEIGKIKDKANQTKGQIETILNITRDVYETVTYEKGKEITENAYKNISKIEIKIANNTEKASLKASKKWVDKSSSEISLNNYFILKEEEDKEPVYIVKNDMRVRIKVSKKVDAIKQQFTDIFRYGEECQKYYTGLDPDNSTYPDYNLINDYYNLDGYEKTLITSELIKGWIINSNFVQEADGSYPTDSDTGEKILKGLCNFIENKIAYISNDLMPNYQSFSGIWIAYKPKFEAIVEILKDYITKINEFFPNKIVLSTNSIEITHKEQTIKYNLTTYNEPWESDFNTSDWENLYSIYWYRYEPGYKNTEDKIISKDWEKINLNFGLPSPYDDGKTILYWDKRTTGENLPKFDISSYLRTEKKEEKFKVVIVFNHNKYESDELIFSNVDEIVNLSLVEQEKFGFYIDNGENSKDNYQEHYNFTNQLISSNDSKINRTVIARFKDENGHSDEVFDNSWIYWYVPDGATMIDYNVDTLIAEGFSTDRYKTVNNPTTVKYYSYAIGNATQNEKIDFSKAEDRKVVVYAERELYDISDNIQKTSNVAIKYGCIDTKNSVYVKMDDISLPAGQTLAEGDKTLLFHPKNDTIYYYEKTSIDVVFSKKSKTKQSSAKYYFGFDFSNTSNFQFVENKDNPENSYYLALKDVSGTCNGLKITTSEVKGENLFLIEPNFDKNLAVSEDNTLDFMIAIPDGEKTVYKKVRAYQDPSNNKFIIHSDITKDNSSYKKKGIVAQDVVQYVYKLRQRNDSLPENSLRVVKSEFEDSLTNAIYYQFFDGNKDRTDTNKQKNQRFLMKTNLNSNTIYFNEIIPYYSRDGYYCFYKKIEPGKNIIDGICTTCNKNESGCTCRSKVESRKFNYQIKPQFSQDAINNNIMCAIEGERWTIDQTLVAKNFFFGTYGANGTEYSIQVTPSRNIVNNCLTTTLTINLYNGSGEEEEFPEPILNWIGPTSCLYGIVEKDYDGKGYRVDITERVGETNGSKSYTINNYYALLKIGIQLDKVNLESFYPVPYVSHNGYYIDGTTSIIYNSLGTLSSQTIEPYKLWSNLDGNTGEVVEGLTWSINYVKGLSGEIGEKAAESDPQITYLPKLSENTLIPPNLIVSNVDCYPVVVGRKNLTINGKIEEFVWAQPISIIQNCFESTTLNKWDGKFKINEEEGTVLSSMLGAGKKELDNSFSGILIGDVKTKGGFGSGANYDMGLYGFNKGAASFGFNTDGTAFLGKSGKGRILFDGDKGFIASAFWDGAIGLDGITKLGTKGMIIDLENGHIDAHDFRLTSDHIKLDSDPLNADDPWIEIGNDDTFLKFSSDGKLEIRVTNFELTYSTGENLLKNTAPLEQVNEVMSYDNAWYSDEPDYLLDSNGQPSSTINQANIFKVDNQTVYKEYKQGTKFENLLETTSLDIKEIKIARTKDSYEPLYLQYSDGAFDDTQIAVYSKKSGTSYEKYRPYKSLHLILTLASDDTLNRIGKVKPLIGGQFVAFDKNGTHKDWYGRCILNTNIWKKTFYSIPSLTNEDRIIPKSIYEKYFEINADEDLVLKKDIWIRDPTQKGAMSKATSENTKNFLATVFETNTTHRKCMRIDKTNYVLKQTLKTGVKAGKNYTLSGKVWVNNGSQKKTIKFKIGNSTAELECAANKEKWYNLDLKFRKVEADSTDFQIIDETTHDYTGGEYHGYYTLFYQLKLEEGLFASSWTQSTEEENYANKVGDSVKNASDNFTNALTGSLSEGLSSAGIFNKLTENGTKQGIFIDPTTNNFYISAECIGVGMLRSQRASANIKLEVKNKDNQIVSEDSKIYTLDNYDETIAVIRQQGGSAIIKSVQVTEGTLFDLNTGYLGAKNFELDAWDVSNKQGLYFNSAPNMSNSPKKRRDWFRIGCMDDDSEDYTKSFLQFRSDGYLKINIASGKLTSKDFDLDLTKDLTDIYKIFSGYSYGSEDYKHCAKLAKYGKLEDTNTYCSAAASLISRKEKDNKGNIRDGANLTGGNTKIVKRYYDLNGDGKITTTDANLIKKYYTKMKSSQKLRLKFNKDGLVLYSQKTGTTTWDQAFGVTPGEFYLNNGLNITTTAVPNDQYYYVDNYEYDATDATLCQNLATAIAKGAQADINDAYIAAYNKIFNGNIKTIDDEKKANVISYYDINGDGKIKTRDAKLIKSKAELNKSKYGGFKMQLLDDGIFCYRVDPDDEDTNELLFSIDYSGVYIKEYTTGGSGLRAGDSMVYGTDPPGKTTPGYEVDGSLYFKII